MTPDLSRRLGQACKRGNASPAERALLIEASSGPEIRTATDMPPGAQALLHDLETRTPQ